MRFIHPMSEWMDAAVHTVHEKRQVLRYYDDEAEKD